MNNTIGKFPADNVHYWEVIKSFSLSPSFFQNKTAVKTFLDQIQSYKMDKKEGVGGEFLYWILFLDYIYKNHSNVQYKDWIFLKDFIEQYTRDSEAYDVLFEVKTLTEQMVNDFFDFFDVLEEEVSVLKSSWEDVSRYENDFNNLVRMWNNFQFKDFIMAQTGILSEKLKSRMIRVYIKREQQEAKEKFTRFQKLLQSSYENINSHFIYKYSQEERERIKEKRKEEKNISQFQQVQVSQKMLSALELYEKNSEIRKMQEKITKFATRVGNLLQKGFLTEEQQGEVMKIQEELEFFRSENPEIINFINSVKKDIDQVLTYDVRDNIIVNNNSHKDDVGEKIWEEVLFEKEKISEVNQKIIEIVEEKMLPVFTYSLSSTKNNTTTSYGDGSFSMKILQPFLKSLVSEVLMKRYLSFEEGISWKNIIWYYENKVDDSDMARSHFVWLLKKRDSNLQNIKWLFEDLYWTIEEFSKSNFYHKNNGSELNLVLTQFEKVLQEEIF